MRRFLVFVCMIGSLGACVNLGKPEQVAECSAKGTCVNNTSADGGPTSPDGKADSDAPYIEGTGPDGGAPTDDALPRMDGNENPDLAATDSPPASVVDGGAQPDLPGIQIDSDVDLPITTGDAPDDAPTSSPDTRDGNKADVPAGACLQGGQLKPAGTPCRGVGGLCDVEEVCDGVSADCPADKLAASGTECRPANGDCDKAETCTGTSVNCPADGFQQAGKVCRPVATGNLCDVAESCTGTSAACPVDSLAPSSTVCRASTDNNKCDPEENCTGSSVSCPIDVIYTKPAVPTAVAAAPGTQQATLTWTAASGATGYNVKRSTTSGRGYTTLGGSPSAVASPYVDDGLAAATYYYVVSSINTVTTCESANSTQVSATPTSPCTPPALITNLAATPGNNNITLSWSAPATAIAYTVYRKNASGTADYAPIANNIAPTTTPPTYQDQAVVYGTSYEYVVTASNGTCSSDNSNVVTASPLCTPPATTPTGLAASIPTTGQQVTLTWTGSADAQTYQILRKLHSASNYTQIIQVSGATLTYTDGGLTNGTSYDYVLTSNNGTCASAASAPVTAVPQCSVAKPVIQTPVTVGDKEVDLTWSTPTGASTFILSRKVSTDSTYSVLTSPALTVNSYADTDAALVNGTTYNYVVSASNGNCASANSNAVSATPVCTPPAAPGTLGASAGDAKVTLSWVASPSSPNSYTIQRKTGAAGAYADLFTTANGTTTSYVDTTTENGTTYVYQVRANKGSCSSTYSSEATGTPQPSCGTAIPGTPTATMTTGTQVKLDWTAAIPIPSSYNIGRSTNLVTGYTSIGTVTGSTLTFTDPAADLTIGTTYYYQITAIGVSCSTTSDAGSVTLSCLTPAAPSPTATNSAGAISVSWTPVSGATAYSVTRSPCTGGTCPVVSADQTSATFTDPASGLTNGTTYSYQVTASNANHQCVSGQSTAVSAMSCTIPAAPAGVSARRTGNKQVTISWSNQSGATYYEVLRSTTNGSGYASVGHTGSTSFADTTAANGTVYYYVVAAKSDAAGSCPASGNSAQVSAPSCTVGGCAPGTKCTLSFGNIDTRNGYCWITCDTGYAGLVGVAATSVQTVYVNGVHLSLWWRPADPAEQRLCVLFHLGKWKLADWNYGNGTSRSCP